MTKKKKKTGYINRFGFVKTHSYRFLPKYIKYISTKQN